MRLVPLPAVVLIVVVAAVVAVQPLSNVLLGLSRDIECSVPILKGRFLPVIVLYVSFNCVSHVPVIVCL